jgi:transposase
MEVKSRTRGPARYPPELRARAVARLKSGEASLRQVSREFGVSLPTLIKWRRANDGETTAARGNAPPPPPISEEIERLKLEIERLREERDRLRKGIAILSGITTGD